MKPVTALLVAVIVLLVIVVFQLTQPEPEATHQWEYTNVKVDDLSDLDPKLHASFEVQANRRLDNLTGEGWEVYSVEHHPEDRRGKTYYLKRSR